MDAMNQPWTASEPQTRTGRKAESEANALAEATAARTPSLLFPMAALASIAASATLQIRGYRQAALFVGQWAPTFLLFGLYNKVVKTMGAN